MTNKLEIAIEKLNEYIRDHEQLIGLNYTEGNDKMYDLENKVLLWANRVYENGRKQLVSVGFISEYGFATTGEVNHVFEQKSFNRDLERKISSLKALLEDLEVWGEPETKSIEEEVKTGLDLKFYKRDKTTKKKQK